jgi:hypothetical protein
MTPRLLARVTGKVEMPCTLLGSGNQKEMFPGLHMPVVFIDKTDVCANNHTSWLQ